MDQPKPGPGMQCRAAMCDVGPDAPGPELSPSASQSTQEQEART